MEEISSRVLVKHAGTRSFFTREVLSLVVVIGFVLRDVVWLERNVVVIVEVVSERRHPLKAPAHPLLECLNLSQWRARNHHKTHVAIGKVHQAAFKVVGQKRAAG